MDRALKAATVRKENMRTLVEHRGASFEPIVFSTNGNVDDQSDIILASLSKDWGLAHDCSAGAALRILRGRISNTIDGWNGEILRSLCGRLIVSAVRLSGIAC